MCVQDILENDSITLDWMFKYSLINDIVKVRFHFLQSLCFVKFLLPGLKLVSGSFREWSRCDACGTH